MRAEILKAIRNGDPIYTFTEQELREILSSLKKHVLGSVGNVEIRNAKAGTGVLNGLTGEYENEEIISREVVHNRVVATGRGVIRDLCLDIGASPQYIALGIGGTDPKDSDVALENEAFRAIVTRKISGASFFTFRLFMSSSEGNGSTYSEIGVFADSSYLASGLPLFGGILFARAKITPFLKDSSIQTTISWQFSIGTGV